MKKLILLLMVCPFMVFPQTLEELDFIAPINEGFIAVMKGGSWGFINNEGIIVIDFRNDLVTTEMDGYKYPVFKNGLCLISKKSDGITYFGYIDKRGKTVIEPQFLNATNFFENKAIALHVLKEELGKNDVLGKNVIRYKYFEAVIDIDGNIEHYLNPKGINVVLDKKKLLIPPKITSKQITNNIYAVYTDNMNWRIEVIKN
ncbi:WG repeat-containing protein [Aestuariivivens marinum]|uniref:WG repeat-containing protein n=1 Tax=Aestuariivivens marinum TaxID=2913555 RepID=UPI001F55ED80|nr:WG repeat-containing protein [Aestuariivivens marinum]